MTKHQASARMRMRELSSGQRLVSAARDPAASAMAMRLRSRLRSAGAAERNIQSGMSALDMADKGLAQILSRIERVEGLAMQAANGSLSDDQRGILNTEASSLLLSIEDVAKQTRFNGDRLLKTHKVDVGFLIDVSGSMGGEIARLQSSIGDFRQQFLDARLDVQFGLAEVFVPRDRQDGTRLRADIGDESFIPVLNGLSIAGGRVDPYSSVHHTASLGGANEDSFNWRAKAAERHLIYITDTRREADLLPGGETQASLASQLRRERIQFHTIGDDRHFSTFNVLTANSGGTLHDKGNRQGHLIGSALDDIGSSITAGFGATAIDYQVGPGQGDQLRTGLPIDATLDGLGLADLSISTQAEAAAALDTLRAARESAISQRNRVAASRTALDFALEGRRSQAQSGTQALSRIADLDVARAMSDKVRSTILSDVSRSAVARIHDLDGDVLLRLIG